VEQFDPAIAQWFQTRFGQPTGVQAQTWAAVAQGQHVLATAPTGSGKTLAAFLWPIQQLLTGVWPTGQLSVLYISPLKALTADIQRNLQTPLDALTARFHEAGRPIVAPRVMVRTGDTTQLERQRMLRKPPEILATTPESLQLLLLSGPGRLMLRHVRLVVLDEIHDVAQSRRGTLLMAGVEQLADLAEEPQRVALSATVRPLERIARFVGGWLADGRPRPIAIVAPPAQKKLELQVRDPAWHAPHVEGEEGVWPPIVQACRTIAFAHRSTLFFTGSRRSAERLARMMAANDAELETPRPPIADATEQVIQTGGSGWVAAHHGSLSREIRRSVEHRLARGELRAVVATSSLELGIDIGDLDEVVLLGAPRSIASAIQRVGRAGHHVGATSHGTLMPLHAVDALVAATLIPLVQAGKTEEIVPIAAPLDVLPQLIIGLCLTEPRQPDALYDFLRRIDAYHELARGDFDRVLEMLRGAFGDLRMPALLSRLDVDALGNLLARKGMRRLLAESGGVIPDRGYFTARLAGSGAKLGELDEEFVWERRVGDEFSIGAQTWRIAQILDDAVEVTPGKGSRPMPPFWRSEEEAMPAALAHEVAALLQKLDRERHNPKELLQLDAGAQARLQDLVKTQAKATRGLPHATRVVVEACPSATARDDDTGNNLQIIVHAPWGGMVLRPLALALQAAAELDRGEAWVVSTTDLCLGIAAPCPLDDVVDLLRRLTPERIEPLLRQSLGKTGLFGARFREAAGRALLLPRRPNKRIPLWVTRQRAKQMLQMVAEHQDFPLIAEVWRTCLTEWMDLPALGEQLNRLRDGEIALDMVRTAEPSPLAQGLVWSQANEAMYDDDVPGQRIPLGEQAVRVAAHDASMRVPRAILDALRGRLLRTLPGWAPTDLADARAWLYDHVLAPEATWQALHRAAQLEGGDWPMDLAGEVVRIAGGLARKDRGPVVANAPTLLEILGQHGPMLPEDLAALLQVPHDDIAALLELARAQMDVLLRPICRDDEQLFWLLPEHMERLLRLTRAAQRPRLDAMPLTRWPAWRAHWQGLGEQTDATGADALEHALRPLYGLPVAVALWESDVLPARVADYQPAWLDALMDQTDLLWLGSAGQKVALLPRQALELFHDGADVAQTLLADPFARYTVESVAKRTGRQLADVARELWELAFRGGVSNDSFQALRQGLLSDFLPPADPPTRRFGRSMNQTRLHPGAWQSLVVTPAADALEESERNKERVRQLADRHGILFREALAHEVAPQTWQKLLPTMRALELGGELVAGHFVDGAQGLQLASPRALEKLREAVAPRVMWQAAHDPASACGLDLPGLRGWLPSRLAGTHLLWHGETLVAVVKRGGALLEPLVPADDGRLADCLSAFLSRTTRSQSGQHGWVIEKVSDETAARSPYRKLLEGLGFHAEMHDMAWQRWGG
jgi:ATP-dependent Lhr-like helicase